MNKHKVYEYLPCILLCLVANLLADSDWQNKLRLEAIGDLIDLMKTKDSPIMSEHIKIIMDEIALEIFGNEVHNVGVISSTEITYKHDPDFTIVSSQSFQG